MPSQGYPIKKEDNKIDSPAPDKACLFTRSIKKYCRHPCTSTTSILDNQGGRAFHASPGIILPLHPE